MKDVIQLGREIAEHHHGREGAGFDNTGKKNAYECDECHAYIVTIDRHPGVTPFMTACGKCAGLAKSKFYRVADWLEPTHEWYRPETLADIPADAGPGTYEHLGNGGLILRPINGAEWQTGDPAEPDKDDWDHIFRMKREMSDLMNDHTIADVMARERSPYVTGQATEGNRHQRRVQARKNRRG